MQNFEQATAAVESILEELAQAALTPSDFSDFQKASDRIYAKISELPAVPARASGGDVFAGTDYQMAGVLTTNHSASSYGIPVFVSDEGQAYGTADVGSLSFDSHSLTQAMVDVAHRAGYRASAS